MWSTLYYILHSPEYSAHQAGYLPALTQLFVSAHSLCPDQLSLHTLLFCMSSVLGHQDFCTDRTGKFFAGPASGGRSAQLVRTEERNIQPAFTWKVLMRFLVRLQIQDTGGGISSSVLHPAPTCCYSSVMTLSLSV